MTPDPIRTDVRRTHRARRFGPDAACVCCGLTTPETLIAADRSILEAHHVCGRANDGGLTVPVCRNCHAILTEGQRAGGATFTAPPTVLHQVAAALASFFAFLADMAERGMAWAGALLSLSAELDDAYPAWRSLPSARALGSEA
ncbi:MAG: HNH endonuclease [Chloroflexota bacterium]|nr:HNH endonuclease [Chloroflexota bacterium]